MTCPHCTTGFVVDVLEQDEDGDYCECLRCLNCGHREYMQPVGKQIEVRKGEYFN